jgi:DNA repair protein RadC
LAILLRVGVTGINVVQLAQKLLLDHGGWVGLQRLSFEELTKIHGLGEAKAAQVKAALEIGRRMLLAQAEQRPQISSPADVAALLMLEMSHLEQEHLRVVLLSTKNHVLKIETVYIGSINSSAVRIGEVFKAALRYNAAALIVVHNHPSGDPTPSPEDVAVTRQLVEAGRLLDVAVLDHLVIGQARWVSLRERRLGFTS